MKILSFALLMPFLALASGCAGVPKLDIAPTKTQPGAVSQIIGRMVCEIATSSDLSRLKSGNYVIAASLQFQADDNLGLTPSLSFIHPLKHAANTNQTTVLSGELSNARQRKFNHYFQIVASEMQGEKTCPRAGDGLSGDLGLGNVIAAGFGSEKLPDGVHYATAKGDPAPNPSFGSTVQFTYKRSLVGGPNWTRTHFKGPNGKDGLIGGGRTDTNQLIIAFAPAPPPKAGLSFEGLSPEQRAASDAQSLLSTMILQNLNITR